MLLFARSRKITLTGPRPRALACALGLPVASEVSAARWRLAAAPLSLDLLLAAKFKNSNEEANLRRARTGTTRK